MVKQHSPLESLERMGWTLEGEGEKALDLPVKGIKAYESPHLYNHHGSNGLQNMFHGTLLSRDVKKYHRQKSLEALYNIAPFLKSLNAY